MNKLLKIICDNTKFQLSALRTTSDEMKTISRKEITQTVRITTPNRFQNSFQMLDSCINQTPDQKHKDQIKR